MHSTSLLTLPADHLPAPSLSLVPRPRFGAAQTADRPAVAALRSADPMPTDDAAQTPAATVSRPRVRRLVVFTGQLS